KRAASRRSSTSRRKPPGSTKRTAGCRSRSTGLKKSRTSSTAAKRALVDRSHSEFSVRRQCELLGLARSSYYHQSRGESEENQQFMRAIDEIYTRWPFYGSRRIADELHVNRKRVQRLMRLMGI